jgi:glycosyltransferase involved in cell wall biosynthesis
MGPTGQRIRWEHQALPKLLRELDPPPDLFHATWNHGIPRGISMPSVLTLHDVIPWILPRVVPWPRPSWIHRWLYRRAVRAAALRAAVITTVSDASRRDITTAIPRAASRTYVVPNALPRWFTAPDPLKAEACRAAYGDPYWLYLGGFDPRKGVLSLLGAMAAAFPNGGPTLVLAGGPNEYRGACESLARELGVRAIFPGYLPDADLPALYAGASLFVYPSHYEGFGIPPLLALAAGTPCITTDGGALPEVVGDAAWVVPAGDPRALAAALRRAVDEPDSLRALAAAGPRRAAAFSAEALRERMLRAYERALGRRVASS